MRRAINFVPTTSWWRSFAHPVRARALRRGAVVSIALCAPTIISLILIGGAHSNPDLRLEVGRVLLIIAGNVGVTGVISYGIFSFLADREEHHASIVRAADTLGRMRKELKVAFEKAELVRFMLFSDASARSVLEQFPALFEARALLQDVQRERALAL